MKILSHPPLKDITLSNILYALGDDARRHIVKNLLAAEKPLTCIEAVKGIKNLPLSTRSHCFQLLRQAGIIRSEKKGRECYSEVRIVELEKKFPALIQTVIGQL
jgi:predicted transcriptional regulator